MNSPNCKKIQDELLEYLEKEMSAEERERVTEHLAECGDCNKEYKGLRLMFNQSKNLAVEDPGEEFWQQLPQKVLAEVRQERMKSGLNTSIAKKTDTNNVFRLQVKGEPTPNNTSISKQPTSQSTCPTLNYHTDNYVHRFTTALAVAAIVLLVTNIMVFSPNTDYLWFDQAQFQTAIHSDRSLSQLAHSLEPTKPSARLGFVEQERSLQPYNIGAMLAEASAYLQDGRRDLALPQLQRLQQYLQQGTQQRSQQRSQERSQQRLQERSQQRLQERSQQRLQNSFQEQPNVSAVTLSSIRKAIELLQPTGVNSKQAAKQLAIFQRDYDNFLLHTAPQQLALYRAGIWVVNASLAVAAKDATAFTLPDITRQLGYLQNTFERLNAPAGVRASLEKIAALVDGVSPKQQAMSGQHFRALQRELRNLQALLS